VTQYHPRKNDAGQPVEIRHPSVASPLANWSSPTATATVVPDGTMPPELNGVAFTPWQPPSSDEGWAAVEGQAKLDELPLKVPAGMDAAAGTVIEEADGRMWLVAPTNGYAGYKTTFPKGRPESGASLQVTAIREAYEEAGLKVEITGFLADLPRSQTQTRYYTARRVGGTPAAMDWESQAVHLVPRSKLAAFLTNPYDKPFLKLLGG